MNTDKENKAKEKRILIKLLLVITVTVFLLTFYQVSPSLGIFTYVSWGYMILATVLIVVYILYNRGMSRNGITAEMLPEDWDEDKKRDFIDSAKKRMKRSQWMLIVIFGILFTFAYDAIVFFVIPYFKNLFNG